MKERDGMAQILGGELLRGEFVYLDRMRRDDLPALTVMWSDIEFVRHIMRRPAYGSTLEDTEEWYQETLKDDETPTFVIRTLDGDHLIGACGFKDLRWAARHTSFWIGIGDREMRGRGFGSDATLVLLKYAFMELNLNCVALEVMSYNERALATYRRVGFHHDGASRAYSYRDGDYYDMVMMSMLRSEWEALHGEAARRPLRPQS
jgi:RimJ/RimL family protein N-acetyltransferase